MTDMTDETEAVAMEKLRADLDEATKQHMPAMVVTTDYLRTVLDTIAAQKAQIKRLERALRSIAWPMNEAGPWAQAVAASALPGGADSA
jgi:uncharacterized membrane protein YccC